MKPIRRAGAVLLSAGLVLWINATPAHAQDRGKAKPPADFPTLRAKVSAYEADTSITLEIKVRGGQVDKTEFAIVKDKTKIELGAGVKAIELGMMASVWAEKDNPKNAARIVVEPEAPTARGKVTAYEADKSITVETPVRGGGVKTSEFSIVKDKTQIELGTGVKAIEVGMMVSVWVEKENSKNAARIATQAAAAPGRNRGGAGAAPADKGEGAKPAAAGAGSRSEARSEASPDMEKVLKAYKDNLPTDKKLEWYTLDWVNSLGEARERAAKEDRPILFIHTNKEGDLFCSLC